MGKRKKKYSWLFNNCLIWPPATNYKILASGGAEKGNKRDELVYNTYR